VLQSTSIAAIISMDDDKESEMKRLLEAAGVGGHMSLIIGAGVDDSAWLASCDDDGLNEVTDLLKGAGMPGGHALKLKLYIKGLRRAEESKPKVPLFGKVGTVMSSEPVATQIEAGMCGADPAGSDEQRTVIGSSSSTSTQVASSGGFLGDVVANLAQKKAAAHGKRVTALLASDIGRRLIFGRNNPSQDLTAYQLAMNKAAIDVLKKDGTLVRWEGSNLKVGGLIDAAKSVVDVNFTFTKSGGSRSAAAGGSSGRSERAGAASGGGGGVAGGFRRGTSHGGGTGSNTRVTAEARQAELTALPVQINDLEIKLVNLRKRRDQQSKDSRTLNEALQLSSQIEEAQRMLTAKCLLFEDLKVKDQKSLREKEKRTGPDISGCTDVPVHVTAEVRGRWC
jgi:hypothetical protein